MVTYHGTTVKLVIENLTAEGKIQKEYIGTLDGGAADITFYTKNFPITTGAGVTTDTETEVDVFTDEIGYGESIGTTVRALSAPGAASCPVEGSFDPPSVQDADPHPLYD